MTDRHRILLIVDDDAAVARVIGRQMQVRGYEAVAARSLDDARRILAGPPALRPDVVLLDSVLDKDSGLGAIAPLSALSGSPVVMMTGHFDGEFRKDALAAGARDAVGKPIDFELLDAVLRRVSSGG